ncbi:MAG TPA: selenium-binding protein SBP56-related protein, partial [Gaiellaceae bacterium]|nr:selenium-binding protein SBP56-related protein [Gaiellaceae bacterium]
MVTFPPRRRDAVRPRRRGTVFKRFAFVHERALVALVVLAVSTAAVAVGLGPQSAAGGTTPLGAQHRHDTAHSAKQERYLYIATIAQSATDPDFVTIVGADPKRADFGTIVGRVDMPNVGDELHHIGYSHDQRRLVVPGLFSNRIHILGIEGAGGTMSVDAVNDELAAKSGYIIPHTVIATKSDKALVTMIGAASGDTTPGGIVEIDTRTGVFTSHFGPGPARGADDLGPEYMYDFDALHDADLGISTTFGPPARCGGGIDPTCLGDEVAVWDLRARRVKQVASLGTNSGALEVRFIERHNVRRAFINT